MIYYAVLYMKDGQIHLMPHETKEAAEATCAEICVSPKWRDKIDTTKVVKKDPEMKWFKAVKGYWI